MSAKTMWVKSAEGKPVLASAKINGNYVHVRISVEMAEKGVPVEVPVCSEFMDRLTPKQHRKAIFEKCSDPKEAKAKHDTYMKERAKKLDAIKQTGINEEKLAERVATAVAKAVLAELNKAKQ